MPVTFSVLGQNSAFDNRINEPYQQAMELFEKEKYVPAQKNFLEVANNPDYDHSLLKGNAQYYALICAIELFNEDAEVLGDRFISQNPDNPYLNNAYFRLGLYEYYKKLYKKALNYFSKVNKGELSEDDFAEYNFKTGYSWFMIDSLDKARIAFYEIKDIDNRYASPAIYYYSHVAYVQKNYETAISGFSRLKSDETFAPLVPYYITQCYYFQEKYDDLLNYAPALIDSVVETRVAEMARMVGDACYHKSRFKDAILYYERYFDKGKDFKPEDYYQAGFCYYNQGMFDKASKMFEKSSSGETNISQNSNYFLGDCYIKLKMKDKALLAFSSASKMNNDPKIKEDASFNYAVLTFELSNSPFNSSIKALNDYINQYPDSRRTDEAYNYLISAYLNTKNYNDALIYLDKIKIKDKSIKKAYQRASFFRGLELFNDLQFEESLKKFELSLKYADYDPSIAARSYYWTGETFYRLKEINNALDNYNLFLTSEASKKCSEYKLINYNIGYCWFNKKDYTAASLWFIKYIDNPKVKKDNILADVYNRLGDCSFVDIKYSQSVEFYTKAIEIGLSDKDYSIFQKAFTLGLLNDNKKKISLLNQLITSIPDSKYVAEASYEIGRSYVALQKPDEAVKYYNKLMKDFPSSSFYKNALLQLGLIDYNAGQNIPAIEKYKKVVADYPGSPEARSALTGIKNIYVEMNDVDSYLKYTETLGSFANVSISEQDSLMYYAGENVYTSGDFEKAKDNFRKYLEKFPQGNFVLNASYYLGDCDLKAGNKEEALKMMNIVINKPRNNFSEQALVNAAKLNMENNDLSSAIFDYQLLDSVAEIDQNIIDARLGQMQIFYQLKNYSKSIETAQKVLKTEGIVQESERRARYILAKSLLASDQQKEAIEQWSKLASDVKNSEGAEAKFLVAKIYFDQGQIDKAQKEIFSFIELNSPHQYWVAKAYILLSGIYHDKKDDFQATNTLQSIIDNYDNKNDGIIKEATDLKLSIEGKVPQDNSGKGNEDPEKDF